MTDSPSYPVSATEALIAKWRAAAKRHEAAAEEPNMDAQEYTLHDECHRVYSKCADELARIGAAQAPAYPEGESQLPLQYEDGPDYCTVRDAQGRDFALTMRPDLMKAMERALAEDIAELSRPPAQAGRDPEVVAAVQQALMKHPGWEPCLGSSAFVFAFGLANTAIDAYRLALPSTDPRCTCAAIVNPNIPHARSCPLSSTNETGAA